MRTLRRTFAAMSRPEKILLGCFAVLLIGSSGILLRRFYYENTESTPMQGGTYIEGSVGAIHMLNPWFIVTNDVNRDISSLVFSGLQRYNPFSGLIEDDLAVLTISGNHLIYTLRLRENIFWHDSSADHPYPVTADDVLFTYQTIQKQGFPNPILQKNFRGVDIEKIDERTVQFRLEKPYAFFRSNLTLGILPQNHLGNMPVESLSDAFEFNMNPVGCGPFRFRSIAETPLSTEVTLERFETYDGAKPFLERVVFRAFPDYPSLLSDLQNLNGVRHVPHSSDGRAVIPPRYNTYPYTLPQYVALFFNMDHSILDDPVLRLALQLATDKKAVADAINETIIVDTPLLEFAPEDWQYRFQPDAAQGALHDSRWHLPEKARLQQLLDDREKNDIGALRFPQSVVLLENGASLTLTGSAVAGAKLPIAVNGLPVSSSGTGTGNWMVTLATDGSSGSIAIGRNAVQLTETGGRILDTFILTRAADPEEYTHLIAEQELVLRFLERSATGVTATNLKLDNGILRLRREGELYGIRVNDRGEPLRLTLLTSPLPPAYRRIAEEVRRLWRNIGVEVTVEVPEEKEEFESRVIRRDYDVLLFGQPLLDNLDSYPYWHSSQVQIFEEAGGERQGMRLDANNLSQFMDFRADALLEQIRETHNEDLRRQTLDQLRDVFREEIPAVVLYSPTYVFAVEKNILGVTMGHPSLHSDRFLSLHRWFIRQGRTFRAGTSWWSFFPWLLTLND